MPNVEVRIAAFGAHIVVVRHASAALPRSVVDRVSPRVGRGETEESAKIGVRREAEARCSSSFPPARKERSARNPDTELLH